jgi:uncharacterized damage-inducible protein DinB
MQMSIPVDISLLYRYTNWASDRVVEGASQLSQDQLVRPLRADFLSTLGLLVHIMAAERIWLSRWKGESPQKMLAVDDVPTLKGLQEVWSPLRAEMLEFVTGVEDANRIVTYRTTRGVKFRVPLWHLMLHVVNHGTEHRSQVALYLAIQGIDVGNLDLIHYLR